MQIERAQDNTSQQQRLDQLKYHSKDVVKMYLNLF